MWKYFNAEKCNCIFLCVKLKFKLEKYAYCMPIKYAKLFNIINQLSMQYYATL